jgi:hypothetical protein
LASTFNRQPQRARHSSDNAAAITAALTFGDGDEEHTAYRKIVHPASGAHARYALRALAGWEIATMNITVDLVIVGITPAGMAAAIDAARCGRRVLVVDRSTSKARLRRFRHALANSGSGLQRQVRFAIGVDVVCVDRAKRVEAVVLRRIRTRQLVAVNASDLLVTAAEPVLTVVGSPDIRSTLHS